MIDVVVDTMPASSEGSAAVHLSDAQLDQIVERLANRLSGPSGVALEAAHEAVTALVEHLLAHAVKRGEFVLRSGKRSDWFIDAKQTTCRPEGMLLVADAFLAVLPDDVTAVGGLTMGADAIAFGVAGVAATRGRMLRSFSVRKEDKDHGAGGRIAGALEPGDRVALTDDAITRGVAFLEAADGGPRRRRRPRSSPSPSSTAAAPPRKLCEAAGIGFTPLVTAEDLGFPYEG